ncbi:MAG TPA: aminotransferase class I/II-fold pyridoxal phosphate-dependent enzyme [Stellaceae bacterium]|jgi:histidinol-phosphate aminotransferase|nr:aminotransferase class I/II-fold pyridoxal phosphate-dependent enzyme [Stellaceae bacterium]
MTGPRLTPLVEALSPTVPFVGPETIERRLGQVLDPRLGANESLFGMSPHVLAAIGQAAMTSGLYADPEGWELRQALARRHGVGLDHIVLGGGIDELLGLFVRAYGAPGAPVVMSTGGYPTFTYHVHGYGCRLVTAPYRDFANDLAALAEAARREDAAIVYLSNPDNPTGSWVSTEAQMALLAALPPQTLLLLDEAYADFAPAGSIPQEGIADPRLVRLRTFSKAQGLAGLRVGYAYGDPATIRPLDRLRNHFGMSRVSLAAALASIEDQAHVDAIVAEVARGRREYEALAAEFGLKALPSATNFVAIDMGDAERARRILTKLIEQEAVFIRMPGTPPLDRCIRVTIGRPVDRQAFAAAFTRVMKANS